MIPFEEIAKSGGPMPDDLSAADVMIFQAIGHLVARYRLGYVSAEQSRIEMAQIRRAYERAEEIAQADRRASQWVQDFHRSTEWALDKFGTDRTLENAEIMWRACSSLEIYTPTMEETTHEHESISEPGNACNQ